MFAKRASGVLLAGALVLTVACSSAPQTTGSKSEGSKSAAGPAQEITLEAKEFSFVPSPLSVQAGQPMKLTLKNTGAARHDWVAKIGTETVKVVADPGQTKSVTFTPKAAGSYEFICSEPGHEPAGMKGTLTVN